MCKRRDKETVVSEEITSNTENLSALHRDNREDVLKASQESVKSHHGKFEDVKRKTNLKDHGGTLLT